ncbi:MAG: prolyl oligopeptidase family serine peptidase [Fibrella sp.]|nr:prolyl oligopeptidase family serine peptidase [Armatimonadota bacterium]
MTVQHTGNRAIPFLSNSRSAMPRRAFLLRGMVLALVATSVVLPAHAAETDPATILFTERTVTTPSGTYKYLIHIPAKLDRRGNLPVIVFLHGSGERGDDNTAQTKNGIRLMIAREGDGFPAVVVAPQCRADNRWTAPEMEAMVMKALDQTMTEFNGDPQRVYLTGLSMGAYGTWELAKRHPNRWAALAPVCGGIVSRNQTPETLPAGANPVNPYSVMATAVAPIPQWIFHGDADGAVPVSESRQMAAILYARKADVRYTEYPGVGHNSWDYAYKEPDLLPWLLAHKRKK